MAVVAVDFSGEAMRLLAATARTARLGIWPIVANLDSFHLKDESFDAIVNINFLDRALFPKFARALRPGGVLIAETFLVDQAAIGHPRDPRFLLDHGELRALAGGLEVEEYREGAGHLSKRRSRISRVDSGAAERLSDGARDDLQSGRRRYRAEAEPDSAVRLDREDDIRRARHRRRRRLRRADRTQRRPQDARAGAGRGHGQRRHQADDCVRDRAPRHRRHRLRGDVRQRHHLSCGAAAVFSRLHRLGQARKENRARYRQGRRARMRSGRHEPGRRRDRAAQRFVQARRVRPGRLRRWNRRARANPRAFERARRRRADRTRIQRTSLQRLLAGAPRS